MQLISVSHGVGYMTFTCLLIMTEYRNCIYSNNLSNPVHYVLTILYNLVKVILDPKSCLRNRVIFMQDHIPYKPFRICLPNSKLLSGIYGMWSFMQITQHNFLLQSSFPPNILVILSLIFFSLMHINQEYSIQHLLHGNPSSQLN